jgi:hypothetical protein
MQRLALSCAAWAAACATPAPEPPEPPDAPEPASGLTLAFVTVPQLPGGPAGILLREVYLSASVIRAVGDATPAGEADTTRTDVALAWSPTAAPEVVAFREAAAGEYAYVELRIAGPAAGPRHEAIAIRGDVLTGAQRMRFAIEADGPSTVARIPARRRLDAGQELELTVALDLDALLGPIDFLALPHRDGTLWLDAGSPAELTALRARLASAFSLR